MEREIRYALVLYHLFHLMVKIDTSAGPILYLNMAGQPVVVVNTHKVAADLLGICFSPLLRLEILTLCRSSLEHLQ